MSPGEVSAMTVKTRAYQRGRNAGVRFPGRNEFRVERRKRGQKTIADFKPCGISEKYADSVQLSIRNSDTSNSKPNLLFRVTILRNANGHAEP